MILFGTPDPEPATTGDTTAINWDARLLELAQAEAHMNARGAIVREMRQFFYDTYVKPYDDELAALVNGVLELETALKDDAARHVQATGEIRFHEKITFQRRTRWAYDRAAMLQAAMDEGADWCVRRKFELNVRAFEQALDTAPPPWADAERVAAPVVAIAKLGDLLIASLAKGIVAEDKDGQP